MTYGYDGNNHVTSVVDSLGGTVSSYFDALGNLTSRRLSGSTQARVDLTYDANSNLTSISRYADAGGSTLRGTSSLSYDALDDLLQVQHKNAAATVLSTYAYTYDAGRRLSDDGL